MSLFGAGEVCGDQNDTGRCRHAVMFACGNCLDACRIGLRHDAMSGTCSGYVPIYEEAR